MPELFRLDNKEFSKKDNEWQWTYSWLSAFYFNTKKINQITITDHYQQEHPEITNELILNIFQTKLNGVRREPRKKHDKRDIFVEERISYNEKKYRLVFWFKDYTDNHLWVRNCHPQD
jgi:hypothetical protein